MAMGLARLRRELLLVSLLWCALLGALAFAPRAAQARAVLAPAAQFSSQPRDAEPPATPVAPTVPDFNVVETRDGRVRLRVPANWEQVAHDDWVSDDGSWIGVTLEVAPNLERYRGYWNVPGLTLSTIDTPPSDLTQGELLDVIDFGEECTYQDRARLRGAQVQGQYDLWTACGGGSSNQLFILAAKPASGAPMLLLQVQAQGSQAQATFDSIAASLAVVTPSPDEPVSDEPIPDEPVIDEPGSEATAVVIATALNVRSGPGTAYRRLGTVANGDRLAVWGQVNSCAWLRITAANGLDGWVSGDPTYVTLNVACRDIPAVPAAEVPTDEPPAEPVATPAPPQTYDPNLGCYLFQNLVGPELTVTFTNAATGRGETFKVPPDGAIDRCFVPGRYTYTIDAPPPWNSVNGEMEVHAGDLYLFPIGVAD